VQSGGINSGFAAVSFDGQWMARAMRQHIGCGTDELISVHFCLF
jgi:hypothetical protein